MAIRLRNIEGTLVALCAARSVAKRGDIYLDDAAHHALAEKFRADFASEGYEMPVNAEAARLREIGESTNPNREWWDRTYGPSAEVGRG